MCFRIISVLLLVSTVVVRAQEPLNPPAPLVDANRAAVSAGDSAVTLAAAQRAQDMGFPSAAAVLYRELLERPGGDRTAIAIGLATALLDEGHGLDAEKALKGGYTGPRGSEWHLRAAMAAAQ